MQAIQCVPSPIQIKLVASLSSVHHYWTVFTIVKFSKLVAKEFGLEIESFAYGTSQFNQPTCSTSMSVSCFLILCDVNAQMAKTICGLF